MKNGWTKLSPTSVTSRHQAIAETIQSAWNTFQSDTGLSGGALGVLIPECPPVLLGDWARSYKVGAAGRWVAAMGVLSLVRDDRLSLDDPIASMLPGHQVTEAGRTITLSDLLLGLGGFPSDLELLPLVREGKSQSAIAAHLLRLMGSQADFRFEAAGVQMASIAALNATGAATWNDFIHQVMLDPLGMSDTRWKEYGEATYVSGSMISTVPDMLAFLSAILSPDETWLSLTRVLSSRHVPDAFPIPGRRRPGHGLGGVWIDRPAVAEVGPSLFSLGAFGGLMWGDFATGCGGALIVDTQLEKHHGHLFKLRGEIMRILAPHYIDPI